MDNYIVAILFGFVQGVTELLPVSSSGHLLIFHNFFHLPISNELGFDVVLHLATLLAVVIYFWRDIGDMIRSLPDFLMGQGGKHSRLIGNIIIATIPAAIIGYLAEDLIENVFRSIWVVIIMLVVVAILFILVEKLGERIKKLDKISKIDSLLIGLAQALALIPGTSRSGITILAGLGRGINRAEAAKFSFLMSIPIILGASLTKIPEISSGIEMGELGIWIAAFLAAFFSAIITINFLFSYIKKNNFLVFAYYRIFLAIILVLYFMIF